jgi:hypothetical protein
LRQNLALVHDTFMGESLPKGGEWWTGGGGGGGGGVAIHVSFSENKPHVYWAKILAHGFLMWAWVKNLVQS